MSRDMIWLLADHGYAVGERVLKKCRRTYGKGLANARFRAHRSHFLP